ncbi:unnamed protein product [Mortierella alpina]
MPSDTAHQEGATGGGHTRTAAQIRPSGYLSPNSHRRTRSADGGRRESDYTGDTCSISSTRSTRSKISRMTKSISRFFKGGSKDRDVEGVATTPTSTPPPSHTTTTTIVAGSKPALVAEAPACHRTQKIATAIPEVNINGVTLSIDAAASDATKVAKPSLQPESVVNTPVHRIDIAVPEVCIKGVPLTTRRHPQPNTSGNDAAGIAVPATSARGSRPPLARPKSSGARGIDVFPNNIDVPSPTISLPKGRFRFDSTPQLAFCITLLQTAQLPQACSLDNNGVTINSKDRAVDTQNRQWVEETVQSQAEFHFILNLAPKVVAEFVKDANKNSTAIAEIVLLAQALDRERYGILLRCFIADFERSCLLGTELLQGLVLLVQSASPGFLDPSDLVKILAKLSTSLQSTHPQSPLHPYLLTLAVSRILDVMADHKVQGLDREALHEPLSAILLGLRGHTDPHLMYQACYAFQALQRVPDIETTFQSFLRHSTGMVDGLIKVSGLIQLNFTGLMEGLKEVREVVGKTADTIKTAYEGIILLAESGKGIFDSAREGFGSGYKRQWYLAIRGATRLVQEGRLADLRSLITDAQCRQDPFFQMGICQLLGEIADDDVWDDITRKQAIEFIRELHQSDQDWGQEKDVKEWMRTIICRVSKVQNQVVKDHALSLMQDMKDNGDSECSSESPLRPRLPLPDSYPLLNRAQDIPDIEMDVCKMVSYQGQELSVTGPVYIPPQAKASLQEPDTIHSPLMEELQSFLQSERLVFLLMGDAGAGKTTFNSKLALDLCKRYTIGSPIPLFVRLPLCERPGHDMIAEELKRCRFLDAQIKELEQQQREILLICDGYDERQLSINLHNTNRLSQPGRWNAKLIVSCRSQYLKNGYRHDFLPTLNRRSHCVAASDLFQEAVIVPFTDTQIEAYVKQFVELPDEELLSEDRPRWTADEYMKRLRKIPNLMEIVGNPFLLSVSLQVLHLIIGTNADLESVRITGVQLYDIFAKEWVERGEKRLQARKSSLSSDDLQALETLYCDRTSFAQHAINYMKSLSTAIIDNQAKESSTIEYSQVTDCKTWKAKHFQNSAENRLFWETSLLVGTGIERRFLHRSLLEYFYSLVFFDPSENIKQENSSSSSDVPSYDAFQDSLKTIALSKRSIAEEPLVVQFLAERARTEPEMLQLLVDLMDTKLSDDEPFRGAINARAILIAADIPYRGVDLRTISDQYD